MVAIGIDLGTTYSCLYIIFNYTVTSTSTCAFASYYAFQLKIYVYSISHVKYTSHVTYASHVTRHTSRLSRVIPSVVFDAMSMTPATGLVAMPVTC